MNWGMMTKAERDAAYNNSDAVKNSAELNAARIAASEAFRKAHPKHLDLRYGPKERNVWDLFPSQNANAPCLVFIHGGYWQRNSRDQFASLIAGVHAHGWAAVSVARALPPLTASLGMLGTPLLAIASSVVLVGEPVTWPLVLGTMLVIAGIAIVIVERAR